VVGLIKVKIADNEYTYTSRLHNTTQAKRQHKYRHATAQTSVFRNSFFPKTILDWNDSIVKIVEGRQSQKTITSKAPCTPGSHRQSSIDIEVCLLSSKTRQVCRSSLSSGRNVRWPCRMLPLVSQGEHADGADWRTDDIPRSVRCGSVTSQVMPGLKEYDTWMRSERGIADGVSTA